MGFHAVCCIVGFIYLIVLFFLPETLHLQITYMDIHCSFLYSSIYNDFSPSIS